jgi:F0F1-type ATP synthase membrane subunit b/b'
MTVLAARAEDISEIEKRTKELETLLTETKAEFDAMQRDTASFARRARATPQRQSAELAAFLRELADRNTKFTEMSVSAEAGLNLMRATLDRVKRNWFG